jgi:hypothetical protein
MTLESQDAMNAVDCATIERKFASADPTKGEEDARVQERGIRAKISLSACSNTKYLGKNAPSLQGIGHADMASSRRCCVSLRYQEICYALYLAT